MGRLKTKKEREAKRARRAAAFDLPDFPDDCTWVGCFGVKGRDTCREVGDMVEAEARRRGAPFVIAENGIEYPPGAIPVLVMYGEFKIIEGIASMWRAPSGLIPALPVIRLSSLKTGEGRVKGGRSSPEMIATIFDDALALHAGTTPSDIPHD